jgi:hypothetical protein
MANRFQGFKSRIAIILVVPTLVIGSNQSTASAVVNPNEQRTFALPDCNSSKDLDCYVEMIVKHSDGSTEVAGYDWIPGEVMVQGGVPRDTSFRNWRFHTGSKNGKIVNVAGGAELTTPSTWNLNKQVGVGFPVMHIGLAGGNEAIDPDDYFSIKVRTSWLNPLSISMYAINADVQVKSIPGGREWIFSGSKTSQSLFNDQKNYSLLFDPKAPPMKADSEQTALYWRTEHINEIPNGSAFSTRCSEFGYTVTSSNASSAGTPSMKDSQTLSYNIAAPHFKSDGSDNKGYFQADLPLAWIDCQWPGNTLTKSPKIEISVLDQNGIPQVSTNSVEIKNKILKVRAYGFHYSAPTIVIKPAKNSSLVTPTVNPSPARKLITIVCTKGTSVKKVTATTPKCPTGWVKKK